MNEDSSRKGMKKLLLTGFEAFGEWSENPTEWVARQLDGCTIGDYQIVAKILPVTFDGAWETLESFWSQQDYSGLVMLGLAGSRRTITPERMARNWLSCPGRPDNLGREFEGQPIGEEGSDLMATFNAEKMVEALNRNHLSADLSDDAGSYVCNFLVYKALNHINSKLPVGFIHLPPTKDMVEDSRWTLEALKKGLILCIENLELSRF